MSRSSWGFLMMLVIGSLLVFVFSVWQTLGLF